MKRFLISLTISTLAFHALATAVPIRVLAWDADVAERKLALSGDKGVTAIPYMHPFKRSATIQVTAGENPPKLLAMDRLDENGAPASEILRIPEGMASPLLLLLPDEKSPTGLRQMVIEDSVDDFRWGTLRFINATGRKLVFNWEKKLAAIPASWKPTDVRPGGANRNIGVRLFLPDTPDRPLYSAVWEQREEFRSLVFLIPADDPRLGPVAFKTIFEDRRVIAAENAERDKRQTHVVQQ